MNLAALDLNLLVVLHAVLEEQSATRAAKRLNVTQSAVSNALGRLRSELGDPLVVRHGRGLVATPRALELAPLLAQGIAQIQTAIGRGRAFVPHESTRTFTIAVGDSHQTSEGPRIAAMFAERLPRANLRMVSLDLFTASDGLATGEIDIVFAPSGMVGSGHHGQHLFDEVVWLVVRRDHPKVRSTLTPKLFNELAHVDIELVLGKRGFAHRAAENHWKSVGLVRRVAVTVPYFTSAAMMATRTDCVAAIPNRLAKILCAAFPLKIVRTTFPLPSIGISMMWHERTDADAGAVYFRQLVADAVRDA
ncbi:Transcriptional regulator, LysR family [Labilithrix luteola]|uniref:Transcriptional regulator, LysR family n=1 Tax=Labilithrix luteola TaxID=1391654 RepID=A0A0K1PY01_9BACT|nr:LysR family transcriptional regulator [Labilithrix luteola]AKU98387.1 Transcriptional regulator, LysR family [Labilithrix luteola]